MGNRLAGVRPYQRGASSVLAPAVVLAGFALVLLLPALVWGPIRGHDIGVHVHWVDNFRQSLAEGCWYPRWLPEVNDGLGSPTFVFYFPTLAYTASLARLLTSDTYQALWLVSGVALWFSGLTMTLYLRAHVGGAAALLGGTAYMGLPYRMLDLYERAALAESMAFAWVPLLLLAIDGHATTASRRWLGALGLATGLLVFTHHGMLVLMLPVVLAYAVLRGPSRAPARVAAILLGLALGAASLVPAVVEREHVRWMGPFYSSAFLFSTRETFFPAFARRLDWSALFCGVAVVAGIAAAWRLRRPDTSLFAVAGLGAFFLAGAISRPLWDALAPLQLIDLPWRWLALSTLSTAILLAWSASRGGGLRYGAATLLVVGIAVGLGIWALPKRHGREAPPPLVARPGWPDLLPFRPRWAPESLPRPRGPVRGSGWVKRTGANCHSRIYDTGAARESAVDLDTFYYPGWRALVNGEDVPIRPGRASGRIELRLPKGRREIRLEFGDTPIRAWAARLSAAALVLTLGLIVWPRGTGR